MVRVLAMCELLLTHRGACILRPRRRGVGVTALGLSGLQRPAVSGTSQRAERARFGTALADALARALSEL